jgi:hypothetical protein
VHKRAVSEVFLTGWRRTGPDAFRITARWPARHPFYVAGPAGIDPLLLVETARQTVPLLSHACFDVPFDHHLVWDRLECRFPPGALAAGTGPLGADPSGERGVLDVECEEVLRRGARLGALTLAVTVRRGDAPPATVRIRFTVLPPAVYERLRARRPAPPADPAAASEVAPRIGARLAGRPRERDVLLGGSGQPHRWWLRVDTGHPVLFDHPVDHVPGMLLLDAARQAAHAELGARAGAPLALHADFGHFVELGTPCRVEVSGEPPAPGDPSGGHRTRVLLRHPGDSEPRCATDLVLAVPEPAAVPAAATAPPSAPSAAPPAPPSAALPGPRGRAARAAAGRG